MDDFSEVDRLGVYRSSCMSDQILDIGFLSNADPNYVDNLYQQYLKDPKSLDDKWRLFFEGFHLAANETRNTSGKASHFGNLNRLIHMYRSRGHMIANINPIKPHDKMSKNAFAISNFGFTAADEDKYFDDPDLKGCSRSPLKEIVKKLQDIYCGTLSYEFLNCRNEELHDWLTNQIEPLAGGVPFGKEKKNRFLRMVTKAATLENFLHTKYVGQKRFSLEGCEALIPGLDHLIECGAKNGVKEIVFGMAHRGRLNVLVNILQKSYRQLFTEFEGGGLVNAGNGDGDVKYHLGQSADVNYEGNNVHLSLAFNPSHLEAVNPIVEGMVRAKCLKYYHEDFNSIVPVLIHGDASVAGQGIVYEMATMSKMPSYDNKGTVHIILDNQVGFTANSDETRSGLYPSDIAKITDSPVFHVNADDVDKVAYALELALKARQKFAIDVWVNIIGFRKRGHNEGDDPRFTQPKMYKKIDHHPDLLKIYRDQLEKENVSTIAQSEQIAQEISNEMEESFSNVAKKEDIKVEPDTLKRYWQDIRPSHDSDFEDSIETGLEREKLDELAKKLTTFPENFSLYKKIRRIIENRSKNYFEKGLVDWAMAEQLCFASILDSGRTVRLAGQDSARGTFSHRHSVWKDTAREVKYSPLEACKKKLAMLQIINSQLSEYSVLGFEYGYSLARPHALVIWEAQFGDFANGAQIIIDQFITSGETKWQRHSGIVLMLPHGYEGMGPEHSSARLERFLQCCAKNNMYVVNITSPANLFHALRRQVFSEFRKPLVIMSPKSLLRHPKVTSSIDEFTKKSAKFRMVLHDETIKPTEVQRVVMCTGKIYIELDQYRVENNIKDVAIIRLEQLYPICRRCMKHILQRYPKTQDWVWVQEEPANMGAWAHVDFYLKEFFPLRLISRKTSASPATGSSKKHAIQQNEIIEKAFQNIPSKKSSSKSSLKIKQVSKVG